MHSIRIIFLWQANVSLQLIKKTNKHNKTEKHKERQRQNAGSISKSGVSE